LSPEAKNGEFSYLFLKHARFESGLGSESKKVMPNMDPEPIFCLLSLPETLQEAAPSVFSSSCWFPAYPTTGKMRKDGGGGGKGGDVRKVSTFIA
jgi:hypothetical protein